tara:strand:- start:10641 stop:10934 length:294 start_codon:yes stop_codon:yes gene_type:complete
MFYYKFKKTMKEWLKNSKKGMAVFGAVAFLLVVGWQFGINGVEEPFFGTQLAIEKAVEGSGSGQYICCPTSYQVYCTEIDGDSCQNYKRVSDTYFCP